jgi:hypothetical protein
MLIVSGNEKSCCPTYEAALEPGFFECCSSANNGISLASNDWLIVKAAIPATAID